MVGPSRAPRMEDKLRMPYTNAAIHELQRIQRAGIENFPRMTTQDVEFRGHTIPKVLWWPWVLCTSIGGRQRGWNEICPCASSPQGGRLPSSGFVQ